MTPPCQECENRELSKSAPVLWISERPRDKNGRFHGNRTAVVIPGVTVANPCYKCELAYEYADYIEKLFVGPASHWHDAVGFNYNI